ncbi:hypothetical protein HDU99_006917 [Rhizoclosmatium hyalinum]|nr:hypothetical protein HDU99_006917 [Rhizoclosmatium hyalinum]
MEAKPHVLLLGGNGNLGRLIASNLLASSWTVTSVIRGKQQSTNPNLTFLSINLATEAQTAKQTKTIIDSVKPNFIVWAAASMSNPHQIDETSAKAFVEAAVNTPSVSKVLLVSAYSARRKAAPWWTPADAKYWKHEVTSYPDIASAKLAADEYLYALSSNRIKNGDSMFQGISVRPGWFGGRASGTVALGKGTSAQATVARDDVAKVVVELLKRSDTRGWVDVTSGALSIPDAVAKYVMQGLDSIEGEF